MDQGSSLIITLANVFENGEQKGFDYWGNVGECRCWVERGSNLHVTLVKENIDDKFIRREFLLVQGGDTGHRVVMIHFTDWPDQGVPSTNHMSKLVRLSQEVAGQSDAPICVHCSAGVGRTGVFIATDYLVRIHISKGTKKREKMASDSEVFNVVKKMREMRFSMVQVCFSFILIL
jgi:protein tyrosine phosphatase